MKNKKSIIAIFSICILGIIGTTIAYFSSSNTFQNLFRTTDYSVSVTEEFESPDDWAPGTTTDKRVLVNNSGLVDVAVRISYTEEWTDSNGNTLSLTDNQRPPQRYAIINFANDFDRRWLETVENEKTYYYYKAKVAPGSSSTSFIESVTYNPLAKISEIENCTPGSGDQTVCNISSDGYSGGQYKLTITVETAQYDKYKEIWGTEVEIKDAFNPDFSIISGDLDTVGSEVSIDDQHFYVVGNEDENHVKLLSKYNINVGVEPNPNVPIGMQHESIKGAVSTPSTPNYGHVAFASTNYWVGSTGNLSSRYGANYPAYVYDNNASISTYVNDYVDYLNTIINNVSGRLISSEELNELGCVAHPDWSCRSAPEWVYNTTYWTGSAFANYMVYAVSSWGAFDGGTYGHENPMYKDNSIGVRPLIIIEK